MALQTSKGKRRQRITYTDGSLFNQSSNNQSVSLDSTDEKDVVETNEIVTLQVGERTFKTYQSTLIQSPYFKALLADNFGDKQRDGSYFIDRDGNDFEYLLHFLRCGYVEIPSKRVRTIQMEAQYYQIPMDFTEVSRRLNQYAFYVEYDSDGWPRWLLHRDGKRSKPEDINDWGNDKNDCIGSILEMLVDGKPLLTERNVCGLTKEESIEIQKVTRYYRDHPDANHYPKRGVQNKILQRFAKAMKLRNEYEINMLSNRDIESIFLRPLPLPETFMINSSSNQDR